MDIISPNIFVQDMNKTIAFYQLLGFKIITKVPQEGDIDWAMMSCGNVTFMFQTFTSLGDAFPAISRQKGGSLLLYIQVKEIRKLYERIKDHVTVIKGLEVAFYGATEFCIQDINDYILIFAEDE
jgi:catechol 2,3-dioxygenase-like lactoylglutathione lyase family enzyme